MATSADPTQMVSDDFDGDGDVVGRTPTVGDVWRDMNGLDGALGSALQIVDGVVVHDGGFDAGGVYTSLPDVTAAVRVTCRVGLPSYSALAKVYPTLHTTRRTGLIVSLVNGNITVATFQGQFLWDAPFPVLLGEPVPVETFIDVHERTLSLMYNDTPVFADLPLSRFEFEEVVNTNSVAFSLAAGATVDSLDADSIPYAVPSCWRTGFVPL